jgi:acyl-CoA oxidase
VSKINLEQAANAAIKMKSSSSSLDKATERINVIQKHLNPQLSSLTSESCYSTTTTDKSPRLQFTEQDATRLRDDFIWESDGELRHEIFKFIEKERPAKRTIGLDMSLDAYRDLAHDQTVQVIEQHWIKGTDIVDDPARVFAFFECIAWSLSANVKLSVHYNLYGACLAHLGTEVHYNKYLKVMDHPNHIGCFLMSELTHASNVRQLQTTATYDLESDSFIINTPNTGAQKFWIGNGLRSATRGVIFAQLYVHGQNKGLHALIVPLRETCDSPPYDGVGVKDVGQKLGLNGVDNARFWFKNYKIPRENLLNRYANVDRQGNYTTTIKNPNLLFAKHIGALLQARISVGSGGVSTGIYALSMALRYSYKRRQFGPDEQNEVPLITYRLHQRRLIPLLSETIALNFFQNHCKRMYCNAVKTGGTQVESQLKEVHLLASATKAICTWHGLESLQMAREACGGQGYLVRNILPGLRVDTDITVTLDGDNNLLLQQITQILLSRYSKQFSAKSGTTGIVSHILDPGVQAATLFYLMSKEKVEGFTRGGLIKHYWNVNPEHLKSREFHLDSLKFRQERLLQTLAARLYSGMQQFKKENPTKSAKVAGFEVYNQCQDHAVAVARAYCDYIILERFYTTIDEMVTKYGANHNIVQVMKQFVTLYALMKIEKDPWFVVEKVLSPNKFKMIRDTVNSICESLVPVILNVVDAMGMPDALFEDTIGSKTEDYVELNSFDRDLSVMN